MQSTWAGQFVVSRKRILDNPLRNYQNLLDIFHAPKDHWIWKESWWNHGPSNPTFGTYPLSRSIVPVAILQPPRLTTSLTQVM